MGQSYDVGNYLCRSFLGGSLASIVDPSINDGFRANRQYFTLLYSSWSVVLLCFNISIFSSVITFEYYETRLDQS